MTLTENVKHTAVLARLALTITAAELVIRTSLTVTAGSAGAVHTIKGTAIGRIAATGILILVISVGGMVEQDYTCDFLDHFGVITIGRGNLECSGATGGNLNAVELKLNAGTILVHEYKEFILSRVNERLTNDYFDITLVGSEGLAVSGRGNNAWNAYVASLNIMDAKILFSKSNLLASKLFEPGTDGNRKSLEKHHLFPKAYLKSQGYTDAKINQMANYAFIDWKDNMDILDDAPSVYYPIVCAGMTDEQILIMEEENALPHGWESMSYEDFLVERRKLMAAKIKAAFELLKKNAL